MPDRPEAPFRRQALQQRLRARRELELFMRRLGFLLALLVALIVAGSIGFAVAEGGSVAYGFVRALDTITTVGGIPVPRDTAGRVVSVGLELLA